MVALVLLRQGAQNNVDRGRQSTYDVLPMGSPGSAAQAIGHYTLIETIGIGGMGVVWRARDERLGRDVALKLIAVDSQSDPEARRRFRNEALALTRLNHPNVATVFDVGTDVQPGGSERDYVVMELIPGSTLEDILGGKPLDRDRFLDYAAQLLKGIAAAHNAGVLHRDLKPANIRVTPEGHLKILDFGLAKFEVAPGDVTLTGTDGGTTVGTLPYMAPEQMRGERVDVRADLYGAGAVLYEMATGRRPFLQTGTQLVDVVLNEAPSVPSALNRKLDPAIDSILLKALEKRPDLRYHSAREMLVDLERIRTSSHSITTARQVKPRHGHRKLLIGLIGCALAIAALVWVWLLRSQSSGNTAVTELKSVAVLPLRPIGAEARDEFLGMGLADSIITRLNESKLLIVRPFSTVRRFASDNSDSLGAAKELKVDSVLDGTVQKSGSRLRISTNLLRASDGSSVWAETFDVESDDIFKVQAQVAERVAEHLSGALKADSRDALAKRYTTNPDAYLQFVKGRYYQQQITTGPESRDTVMKAIESYRRAIQLDPEYALAHANLGNMYAWMGLFIEADNAWIERAKQELAMADSIDRKLADTHVARAQILWSRYEGFDLVGAEKEFRNAASIDPGATAGDLAVFYAHLGMQDLAAENLRTAERYAPSNALGDALEVNQLGGDYAEAVERCTASEQKPCPAEALLRLGRITDAEKILADSLIGPEVNPRVLSNKAVLLSVQGKHAEAERLARRALTEGADNRGFHHIAFNAACVYALAGKKSDSVAMLRESAAKGMPNIAGFRKDPLLQSLKGYAEYESFMAEVESRLAQYRGQFGTGLNVD